MKLPKFLFLLLTVLQVACKTTQMPIVEKTNWANEVKNSPVFSQNFTGFALYDIEKAQIVAEYQSDHFFTPASNTKLYSFFAGLKCLGDSIPALRYIVKGDSLIFWGTGDPSFLHPDLKSTRAYNFLKNRTEKLYLSTANDQVGAYGAGWQWDDYNDYYQPEVTAFPIYGNIVRFKANTAGRVEVNPPYFWKMLQVDTSSKSFRIRRDFHTNQFDYQPLKVKAGYEQDVPFRTAADFTATLLSDTLKKKVLLVNEPLRAGSSYQTIYSIPSDSLYKRMLQVSDNMLAEQLVILCAAAKGNTLSTQTGIKQVSASFLADLPDSFTWADGSGLSVYNKFTPRNTVNLLQKMHREVPQQRLFDLLAIGGKAGTLRSQYKSQEPFVFAKSGSISNVYNLSGYLRTKSGKVLIFSLMNNNFIRPTAEIRKEVERILTKIHQEY